MTLLKPRSKKNDSQKRLNLPGLLVDMRILKNSIQKSLANHMVSYLWNKTSEPLVVEHFLEISNSPVKSIVLKNSLMIALSSRITKPVVDSRYLMVSEVNI